MWKLLLGWVIFCILIVSFWHFCCIRECDCLRNWWNKRKARNNQQQKSLHSNLVVLENGKCGNGMINGGFDRQRKRLSIFFDSNLVDLEIGQREMRIQENANEILTHSGLENVRIELQHQHRSDDHHHQQQQNAPKPGWRRQFPSLPDFSLPENQNFHSPSNSAQQNQIEIQNDERIKEEEDASSFHSALSSSMPSLSSYNSPSLNSQFPFPFFSNELFEDYIQVEKMPPSHPDNNNEPAWSQNSFNNNSSFGNENQEEREPNVRDADSFESTVRKIGGLPRKVNIMERIWPKYPEDRHKRCPICLDYFVYDKQLTKSECGFLFHYSCISKWFIKCRTCPVCRKLVSRAKTKNEEKPDNDEWMVNE